MTERRPQVLAARTVAALVIGLSAAAVEAAPRARLSRDLADALQAQRGEARDVILQADQATVSAVAARHGPPGTVPVRSVLVTCRLIIPSQGNLG